MKVSLRKANALQVLIQEQINEPFVGEVTVGKFDNADKIITDGIIDFAAKVNKKSELIEILFDIRKIVSAKNSEVGIDVLLTDLARLEKFSAFAKQLTSTRNFTPDQNIIEKLMTELNKEVSSSASVYGRKDSITVSLMSKTQAEKYSKDILYLRKQKQVISDKLLHLNVSTEIELSAEIVNVLKKYDIL